MAIEHINCIYIHIKQKALVIKNKFPLENLLNYILPCAYEMKNMFSDSRLASGPRHFHPSAESCFDLNIKHSLYFYE